MKRTMCEKLIKAKRLKNWVSYLVGGRRRKMEMGRIIWKRSVVPVLMFGLAAVSGGKGELRNLMLYREVGVKVCLRFRRVLRGSLLRGKWE